MGNINEAAKRIEDRYGNALVLLDKEWRPKADNLFLCNCCGTTFRANYSRIMEGKWCPKCGYNADEHSKVLAMKAVMKPQGFDVFPLLLRNLQVQCVTCRGVISLAYTPHVHKNA